MTKGVGGCRGDTEAQAPQTPPPSYLCFIVHALPIRFAEHVLILLDHMQQLVLLMLVQVALHLFFSQQLSCDKAERMGA